MPDARWNESRRAHGQPQRMEAWRLFSWEGRQREIRQGISAAKTVHN